MMLPSVVELTQSLIKFESVTPGGDDCLNYIADLLTPHGYSATFFNNQGASNLWLQSEPLINNQIGCSKSHLMFVGHVDVVPAGDGWQTNPFAGDIIDDHLYGRGAVDMKGAISAFVITALNNPQKLLSILLTTNEEGCGTGGIKTVVPDLINSPCPPNYIIVGEPTSVDQVGDTIKNGRRGSITFNVEVGGVQGHVAYPKFAANAATAMIHFLNILNSTILDVGNNDFEPSHLEVVRVDIPSQASNIIPAKAFAVFNIRYNNCHNAKSLENLVNTIAQSIQIIYKNISFNILANQSAEPFISHSPDWQNIVSLAINNATQFKPKISTGGGTSDARYLWQLAPLIELGLCNATAHMANENVALKDLELLCQIYNNIINLI